MYALDQPAMGSRYATGSTSFEVDGLHVRSCQPTGPARGAVLFVHGATIGSVLFDIPVPGYSLLAVCAAAGWHSFALDLTGYAQSVRPAAMQAAPGDCPLICTGEQALDDVHRVARQVMARTGFSQLVVVGGSWGSLTAARYAMAHAPDVSKLVLLAPLFASVNPGWLKMLSNPKLPEQLNPGLGGYRYVKLDDVLARWDAEIQPGQADQRRDPQVVQALFDAELQADPQTAHPGAFRAPNGTLHDLFEVFNARPLYDPQQLTVPCLLVRGHHDQTSTAADVDGLYARLGSTQKQRVLLPHGGHFMQAERCAPQLQRHLLDFLSR